MDRCLSLGFVALLFLVLAVHIDGLKPGGRNVCHRKLSYNAYESRRLTRIGYDNYRTCCKKFLGICTSRCTRYRKNVCHRKLSYNAYESRRLTRIGYDNYRTCCKKKWGICTSRCTRYRSKIVTYYNNVLVVRYKDDYYCCAGWAPVGSECTKAICNPGCKNGNCVTPNVCSCRAGFQGKLCESDINECLKNPCQQICNNIPGSYTCSCKRGFIHPSSNPKDPKCQDVNECNTNPCKCAPGTPGCIATCANNVGSFQCRCNSGFKLVGGLTCTDINECASKSTNGCAHKCLNTPGSYKCACNPGYRLTPDGRGCNDINECSTLNGGCSQRCINQVGTYYCACNTGFELSSDKKTCNDINECTRLSPCDKSQGICTNTRGSYVCSCKTGYALQADKKTCKDIDECSSSSLNSCAHNCHNNAGSYYCTCKVGFRLSPDKRGCDDIDECKEKKDTCQHNCHNNVGSYTCSCRPGYKLEGDGRKCKALPCQSIVAPKNGQMKCSGFVTDESCNFNCDEGFNLFGSSTRKCLPTAVWSGDKTSCQPKPCPKIKPPLYGSVLLPCVEEFNSTCLLKCSRGYYLAGERGAVCIVDSGKTRWNLHGSKCKAVEACTPNPCDHGGRCLVLGVKSFSCNCEGTGYIGTKCQTGILRTPSYPQLAVNEKSDILTFRARPDTEIKVTPVVENGEALCEPSTIIITKDRGEGSFTVTPKKSGAFRIKYKLTGADSPYFQQPKEDVVYAVIKRKITKAVSLKADFFKKGCKTKLVGTCQGQSYKLSSTCNWGTKTAGFVAVGDGAYKFPVSAVGMKSSTVDSIYRTGHISAAASTTDFLNNQVLPSCENFGKCKEYEFDADAVNFVIANNLFAEGFYRQFSALTPSWSRADFDRASKSFSPRDILSTVGKGTGLGSDNFCSGFEFQRESIYSVYSPEKTALLTFLSSKKIIGAKTGKCFVVDLCRKLAHFVAQKSNAFNLTGDFASLGLNMISASSYGFGFGSFGRKCLSLGGTADYCVNSNSYWNVLGSMSSPPSSKVEFEGRVDAELSEIDNALIQRLSVTRKLYFKGNLNVDVHVNVLGSTLKIKQTGKDGAAYIQVGGSSNMCPVCSGSGVHLQLNGGEKLFQYGVSTLKLKPSGDLVRLSILKDAHGGKVAGVENLSKLSLTLRLLNTIGAMFKNLQNAMGSAFPNDTKIINERRADLIALIEKAVNLTSDNGADYAEVSKVILQAQTVNRDLKPALQTLEQRLGSDPAANKVKGALRILNFRLQQIESLQVIPKSEQIKVHSQGSIIAYEGDLCVHQLCFKSQDVAIYDVSSDVNSDSSCKGCKDSNVKDIKGGSVLIVATALRDTVLGKKVKLQKGNRIKLYASRKSNVVTGSFEGEINLFKRFYTAAFSFTEKTLSVSAKNVKVMEGLVFDVTGSNDVKKVSWDDVIRNVRGKTSNGSIAVQELKKLAQNYFGEIGSSTQGRLRRSQDRQKEAEAAVSAQKKVIESAQARLKNATESNRLARLMYQRQLVLLNRTQIELQSYMKELGPIFIEKKLEGVCKFQSCKEKCVTMPVCQICQDPVKVDANAVKCDQTTEKIRTNVVETFKSSCELRKYVFIPVYTGNCAEDPGMAAARDRQLKENLAQTGAAAGALIGSVVPGIGTVLGAVVGGIVGFIGGLFSSCDKSYEVYTKTWVEQVECTKMKDVVKVITRPVSECYYVKQKVQTGYDQPRQCNCVTNPCLVKVKEPACLIQNSKCQELRAEFLKNSDKVPEKFTNTYNKVEQLKNNVKAAFVNVRKTEKEKEFRQDEYNRAVIFGKHTEQDKKIATQSQSNVVSLLATEKCILNYFTKSNSLPKHLDIESLSFDSALPLIDNLRLDAYVHNLDKGRTGTVPFLLQFEDMELSMLAGAKKIVRRDLCNAARRRRSADAADHDDLAFTSWYIDSSQNASTVQKACVTFEKTTGYIKHVFEDLYNLTVQGSLLQKKIDDSKRSLGTSSFLFSASGESNVIISAQNKELGSLSNTLDNEEKRLQPAEVLKLWKENAEVYTGLNNVSVCLNLKDCLDVAFKSLKKLPTMFKVKRDVYLGLVERAEKLTNESLISGQPLNKLKYYSNEVRRIVRQMEAASLLCADPPKADISCDETYVSREGEDIKMICTARSVLPVQYVWKKGKEILEDENKNTLSFKADPKKEGFYTCTVVSLAGSATTNGTLLVVEHAPKFTSEPADAVYYNPSPSNSLTSFTCNVTAKPEVQIEWYFASLADPLVVRKLDIGSHSMLTFIKPTRSRAGYYFCRAQNKYGMIQSRKARLDVLDVALADQQITFSFEVDIRNKNVSVSSFANLAKKMKIDNQLTVKTRYAQASNSSGKVTFVIYVTPNATQLNDSEKVLATAAKARQALANSLATVVTDILKERSQLIIADGSRLSVNNETLKNEFIGNICRAGYTPKKDGIMCAECPAGSYESKGKCLLCGIGKYQQKTGQTSCAECDEGEITERKASTSQYSCIHPRNTDLDLVFVLDSSRSVTDYQWKRMKHHLLRFTEFFPVNGSTKIGIISYGSEVFIDVDLGEYDDKEMLQDEINHLWHKGGKSRTYDGMAEALDMFKAKGRKDSKKIVIIMSDGMSSDLRGISGFNLVREESFALRAQGIHVVSVGVGGQLDTHELFAAASYPKENNTFIMKDTYKILPNLTSDIVQKLYMGNCFHPTAVDIGIFAVPMYRYDDVIRAEELLKTLLAEAYRNMPSTVNVAFFNIFSQWGHSGFFKEYRDLYRLERAIERYLIRPFDYFDFREALREIINARFDEWSGSISRAKVLLVITREEMDRKKLLNFHRHYPDEDIKVINIVTRHVPKGNGNEERDAFHTSEGDRILSRINAVASKEYCEP